ncbi:MAG: amidohydrolase family protein, partial [Actinomycetia bacterium]|nr:amidohydrolase family protein [Actinomycetes bacterium]
MKLDLLIKNIKVITDSEYTADISIKDGKIVSVTAREPDNSNNTTRSSGQIDTVTADRIIDGTGLEAFPGGIDAHCHLDLDLGPGRVSCDDVEAGTLSAVNGGITTTITYAYRENDLTLYESYLKFKEKTDKAHTSIFYHSGIFKITDTLEQEIKDTDTAADADDIVSFKIHLNDPAVTNSVLYRALRAVKGTKKRLTIHCEEGELIEFLKSEAVDLSIKSHPLTRPDTLEEMSILRSGLLAELLDVPIYIVHLSSAKGLNAVRELKKRGLDIETETTPQYLLLTEDMYNRSDGHLHTCCPPFRKKRDN